MEEEKRKAYSEVVEILKLIDDEQRLEKIPFEVIELIKNNADPQYKPNINKELPLDEQNLRNETYSILGWIANKYWGEEIIVELKNLEECKVEETESEEKQTIKEVINSLDEKAAVYNDLDPSVIEYCAEKNKLPILKSNLKWYIRIKERVIKLFKILFGKKSPKKENN